MIDSFQYDRRLYSLGIKAQFKRRSGTIVGNKYSEIY